MRTGNKRKQALLYFSHSCSVKTSRYGQAHLPRMMKIILKSHSGEHRSSFTELCEPHSLDFPNCHGNTTRMYIK